jgi:hypothetical protein
MSWEDALEIVLAMTSHGRFRWLCSDENPDAQSREDHRRLMVQIATGDPAPAGAVSDQARMPATDALRLLARMNACPSRTRDAVCGCSGARCAERGGAIVSHIDCFTCLRQRPERGSPP